jgi:long-chain acyl-CoA synthetase
MDQHINAATLALPALLDDAAAKYPSHPAMDFLGKITSYAELARLVNAAAAGFQRLGVTKGARVALCLPNTPYYVICYYAILKAAICRHAGSGTALR